MRSLSLKIWEERFPRRPGDVKLELVLEQVEAIALRVKSHPEATANPEPELQVIVLQLDLSLMHNYSFYSRRVESF